MNETADQPMHYFAYGSNMSTERMRCRCPDARPVGVARLTGYKLAFTRYSTTWKAGVADIVAAPGDTVWGRLFSISPDDLAKLDAFEGYPKAYTRVSVTLTVSGQATTAHAYAVRDKQVFLRPAERYLAIMIEAAEALGFPEEYIAALRSVCV